MLKIRPFLVLIHSAWGQRNESKVSEFVLEEVVKTIEREFNCLEIIGLPKTYQLAISASDSSYAKFFAALLMSSRLSHDEALKKLDRLMHDVGRKLVIYLEDCDRNHDQHQFWLEISTLLDRIGNLYNVSFVFAVGEMKETLEILTKITDHTEIMPKISEEYFYLILENFFTLCKVDFSVNPSKSTMKNLFMGHAPIKYDIFKKMMAYPRNLKKIFLNVFRTWDSLRDEINFEDLFLVCVLKAEAPKVYNFIGDNIDSLRSRFDYNGVSDNGMVNCLKKIKLSWEDSTGEDFEIDSSQNGKDAFAHASLSWDIVEYLFPVLKVFSKSNRSTRLSMPLNGVSNSYPTDYWIRLHAGEIPNDEITDHETIRVIKEIKAGQYANTVDKIIENKIWGDKILQLGKELFENQFNIQNIVDEIINALIKKYQLHIDYNDCHFIDRCFSAMGNIKDLDDDKYIQWLLNIVRKTMEYNMSFSNDFYFQWLGILAGRKNLLFDFGNKRISVIKEIFSDDPEKLLYSLKNGKPNKIPFSTLNYLLRSPTGQYNWVGFKYSIWHFLIPVIMDAAIMDKDLIVPLIADLIFKIGILPEPFNTISVEHRKEAIELFGENYKKALQLICEYDFKDEDQRLCEAFMQCRNQAQDYLE